MSATRESSVQDRISEHLTRERMTLEVRRARGPFLWLMLLLAAALIAFALLLTELHLPAPWQSQYTVGIEATDVTGVQSNDQVRIAGVEVGHVTGVVMERGTPTVSITIDPRYGPLYRNAQVEIRPNTPLQDMYVDVVSRGTRAAGAIRGGGVLPASQTQSPVQIGQVIDIFDAAVRPRVTASINALGAGLGDRGVQLRQALVALAPFLREAQQFTQQIALRRTETARLVHNFALLNQQLAGRGAQLTGLVSNGATTMGRLASVGQSLGAVIDQLPPTLSELPRSFAAVDAAAVQLDPAARALLPTAAALTPALAALRRLSPVATQALAALTRPLPSLTALLGRAAPLSHSLTTAFARLRPQAPQLNRVTAQIIPCESAVTDFFQWTLSVSKLGGPHGDMQRGVALLGPQTFTGFLAPSVASDYTVAKVAPTCAKTTVGTL
jgi:ABC-type transporter Mla subunit MlaD